MTLTPAQLQAVRLVVLFDLTYKEAAERLHCSPKTVQAHIVNAKAILGVSGGSKKDLSIAAGFGWPPSERAA